MRPSKRCTASGRVSSYTAYRCPSSIVNVAHGPVRDLQFVNGDALLPQPPDRGRVVLHPVDEDRARALQVTGEQDRGPGPGDPQAGHGGPHGADLPGQLRPQRFGITPGLGVNVGRGNVDVIQ